MNINTLIQVLTDLKNKKGATSCYVDDAEAIIILKNGKQIGYIDGETGQFTEVLGQDRLFN